MNRNILSYANQKIYHIYIYTYNISYIYFWSHYYHYYYHFHLYSHENHLNIDHSFDHDILFVLELSINILLKYYYIKNIILKL